MAFFVCKKIREVNIFFGKQQDNIGHIVKVMIICYYKENKITKNSLLEIQTRPTKCLILKRLLSSIILTDA